MHRHMANNNRRNSGAYQIEHSTDGVTAVTNGSNSWSGPWWYYAPDYSTTLTTLNRTNSRYDSDQESADIQLSPMAYAERFPDRTTHTNMSYESHPYPLHRSQGMRFLSSAQSIKLSPGKMPISQTLNAPLDTPETDVPPTVSLRDFMTQIMGNFGGQEDFHYRDESGIKWIIENGNCLAGLLQGTSTEQWSLEHLTPHLLAEEIVAPSETSECVAADSAEAIVEPVATADPAQASVDTAPETGNSAEATVDPIGGSTQAHRLFGYAIATTTQSAPIILKVRREAP
jgi:hypothetical protein